jgi:hypothetical protein
VGVVIHQRLDAILVGIGALWAVSQDGLDDWRVRGRRILGVALGGGVGFALGATLVERSAATWALALFSGAGGAQSRGSSRRPVGRPRAPIFLLGIDPGRGTGHHRSRVATLTLPARWCTTPLRGRGTHGPPKSPRQSARLSLDCLHAPGLRWSMYWARRSFYEQRASAVTCPRSSARSGRWGAQCGPVTKRVALRECLIVALRCGEVISYLEGKASTSTTRCRWRFQSVAHTLDASTAVECARHYSTDCPRSFAPRPVLTIRSHVGHDLE